MTIPVQAGWNLITLPLSPTTALDARTVLTSLLAQNQHGYVEIAGYANGRWTTSPV